mmetsp:Transcript_25179/g.44683  ORF Transcript_25179/g.44683 Transcript_25179/m.44683 type:complete len:86 (+) Transcript_25179:101-358(+)
MKCQTNNGAKESMRGKSCLVNEIHYMMANPMGCNGSQIDSLPQYLVKLRKENNIVVKRDLLDHSLWMYLQSSQGLERADCTLMYN